MVASESQRIKYQRGEDFQNEIKRSWPLVPNTWRLRINDAGGGSRPADELVITPQYNVLAELKRTDKDAFHLSFLRPNQVKGLLNFELPMERNLGLVYCSFLAMDTDEDETYAFRLSTGVKFMQRVGRQQITLKELRGFDGIPAIYLPRQINEAGEAYYDLERLVNECYRLS